jgi:hypothetical protein
MKKSEDRNRMDESYLAGGDRPLIYLPVIWQTQPRFFRCFSHVAVLASLFVGTWSGSRGVTTRRKTSDQCTVLLVIGVSLRSSVLPCCPMTPAPL